MVDKWDPSSLKIRSQLRLGGVLGFVGGFLMAYQRSSCELSTFVLDENVTHVTLGNKSGSGAGPRTSGRRRRTLRSFQIVPSAAFLSTASQTSLSGFRERHTATLRSLNSNSVCPLYITLTSVSLIPLLQTCSPCKPVCSESSILRSDIMQG